MSDRYVKVETKITVSANANYSDPRSIYEPEAPVEMHDEAVEIIDGLEIGTGSETFMRTDRYSVLQLFYIKNKDTSNYVTLVTTGLAATSRSLRVLPGQEVILGDVDPGTAPTLQANGAAVLVDIVLVGET